MRVRQTRRNLLITFSIMSCILLTLYSVVKIAHSQVGTITVTGRFQYWDNTEAPRPLVWARVLIYDLEPGNVLDYMGDAITNASGHFTSALINNNDGPGEDGLDIVVFITAWNPGIAVVIDAGGFVYNGSTPVYHNCSDGTLNIGTWSVPHNVRGAWMIFSYHNGLVAGWNYIETQTGDEMSNVIARWPFENWPHYHHGGEIHLPNWAAWQPDIILHEYAHHVMYDLYGYIPSPPGGPPPEHYINETSDANTAWAEGWANFFPLVVQNDPDLIEWNLETPHWCSEGWDDGDEVEGRVAGALWDIFDSDDDGYDVLDDGFHRIWNITRDQNPDTFEEFWDAWNTTYCLQDWSHTLRAIFQNSIDYRGPGDVNVDGKVRIDDVYYVSDLFGQDKGRENWDKLADVFPSPYGDDKIRVDDVLYVALHFGNNYEC